MRGNNRYRSATGGELSVSLVVRAMKVAKSKVRAAHGHGWSTGPLLARMPESFLLMGSVLLRALSRYYFFIFYYYFIFLDPSPRLAGLARESCVQRGGVALQGAKSFHSAFRVV
jgi:hypothetical protein